MWIMQKMITEIYAENVQGTSQQKFLGYVKNTVDFDVS
jgi:hypothetical protein